MNLTPFRRGASGSSSLAPTRFGFDVEPLFQSFFDGNWPFAAGNNGESAVHAIRLDLEEADDQLVVRAEVPGIAPADLDVQLTDKELTISGELTDESTSTEGTRTYTERRFGSFRRSVRLPWPVDAENVDAEHKNGLVTITLKKAASARPRRIEIESSAK